MSAKRQELETIAADFVQRAGLHNLSFRTLANEVGVKSSSVHYYFPEKSALASALITNYSSQLRQRLKEIGESKGTLEEKLKQFIDIFEAVIDSGKLCLCGIMAAEVSTLDEDNRTLLTSYFVESEDWLNAQLEAERDQLYCDLDPSIIAKVVMSGLEGAILIDRVEGGKTRLQAQRIMINRLISG